MSVEDGGYEDKVEEGEGEFFIAGGNALIDFDALEKVFDLMTLAIKFPRPPGRALAVGARRDAGQATLGLHLLAQGCLASIPPRSGRRDPAWFHQGLYRQRYKIENFFQRIKIYKRIATRYDKLALTFLNFVLLAGILDWLKSF